MLLESLQMKVSVRWAGLSAHLFLSRRFWSKRAQGLTPCRSCRGWSKMGWAEVEGG